MTTQEAAQIIETIINSLKENPRQFHISISMNIIGASGTAHGGGIGMQGIAHGGGIGIYASANVNDAKIKIANQKGAAAMDGQYQALIDHLSSMAQELRSDSPDKSKLTSMYESLKGTWVPSVITSVVSDLISGSLMR